MLAPAPADDEESFDEVRQKLEMRHVELQKEEQRYWHESEEALDAGRAFDEQLSQVRDRLAGVTTELGLVEKERADRYGEEGDELVLRHTNDDFVSLADVTPSIATAFRGALQQRLADPAFIAKLGKHQGPAPIYVPIHWRVERNEEADAELDEEGKEREALEREARDELIKWKVFDESDGTDYTFRSLLEDVARYWGLRSKDVMLADEAGVAWPLEGAVYSELRAAGETALYLARLPASRVDEELVFGYTIDEAKLSAKARRAVDSRRREEAAMMRSSIAKSKRKEAEEKRAELFSEFWKYMIFLAIYIYVTFSRRSVPDAFYLVRSLDTAFVGEGFGDANEKEFMDVRTIEEFYDWAQGPFTDALLPAEYYDGTPISESEQRVMVYNRLVGGVRLRQLRIEPNKGCVIGTKVQETGTPTTGPTAGIERTRKYVTKCYAQYLPDVTHSEASFSLGEGRSANEPGIDAITKAFTWQSATALGGAGTIPGQYGVYDSSGFVLDITNLTTVFLVEAFDSLKANNWLDRQTRGLFMSMVVYNANYNLYAVVQFKIELSPAGVILPSYAMWTVQMDIWANLYSMMPIVNLTIESFLYIFLFLYLCNEFRELYDTVKVTGSVMEYFGQVWNIIDWGVVILSFLALSYRLMFFFSDAVRDFDPFTPEYVELAESAARYNYSFQIDSIAAFLCFLRLFRYCELQRNLLILRESIQRGLSDLSVFSIMLLFVIFAFAVAGNNIFGQEYKDFITEFESFKTLFLMVLGEFDFDELTRIHSLAAAIYFTIYQIVVFFIMVNIFLAILNDAYIAVTEIFAAEEVYERETYTFRQRVQQLRDWFKQRKWERRIEFLRKEQRKKELAQRRAARKREEDKQKRIKHMNILSIEGGKGRCKGRAQVGSSSEIAHLAGDNGDENGEATPGSEGPKTLLLRESVFGQSV